MARTSLFTVILFSALVGAIAGAAFSYNVLNKSIQKEVQTQFAIFSAAGQNTSPASAADSGKSGASVEELINQMVINGLDPEEIAVSSVYEKLAPSVVHVSTVQYMRNFFFQVVPQEGTGSGFIISRDGYILTNNHVVAGAQDITVRLSNGEEYPAQLVGTDQLTDLAVLKVSDVEIPAEWVAKLGDSDKLQEGQRAIAIGNPFGLDSTITVGVISALNRPVVTEETTLENMIQTDASINPGNSGGPLLNSAGEVIGINTVILSQSGGSHGIGFAIPVNSVQRVMDDLIQYGYVKRPNLGFNGFTLYANLANALGLSVNYGVFVQEVKPGSAAEQAGLRGGSRIRTLRDNFRQFNIYDDGDIIIAINGEKVDEINKLADQIRRMELGAEVTLTVIRGDQQLDLKMILSE